MLKFNLKRGDFTINVQRNEPERSNIWYVIRGKNAAEVVFRVDGSTVTVDWPFRIRSSYASTFNSIQMSFDCST